MGKGMKVLKLSFQVENTICAACITLYYHMLFPSTLDYAHLKCYLNAVYFLTFADVKYMILFVLFACMYKQICIECIMVSDVITHLCPNWSHNCWY